MRHLQYITVSNDGQKAEEQVVKLEGALQEGYEIISAAGTSYAVHYLLEIPLHKVHQMENAEKAKDEPELAGTVTDTTLPRVTIEDWRIIGMNPRNSVLTGKVTNHPRFDADTEVTTSAIQDMPDEPKQGDEVRTRNTVYILGVPAQ